MPIAINVNMLRRIVTSERQPRTKNGAPPHRMTGLASTSWAQGSARAAAAPTSITPGAISTMAIAISGTDSARLTQNRRVMSSSSGSGGSTALTVRGSSAMPQIGHAPGSAWTTSGCIEQVYSTVSAGAGAPMASSAMPQSGQAPGPSARTSGCIGQP